MAFKHSEYNLAIVKAILLLNISSILGNCKGSSFYRFYILSVERVLSLLINISGISDRAHNLFDLRVNILQVVIVHTWHFVIKIKEHRVQSEKHVSDPKQNVSEEHVTSVVPVVVVVVVVVQDPVHVQNMEKLNDLH